MRPRNPGRRAIAGVAVTAAAVAALTTAAAPAAARPKPPAKSPTVDVQLLNINDFHGNLEPPSGSGGRVVVDATGRTVDAGGAEYLATHYRRIQQARAQKYSVGLGTGDLVGASPLLSALFHDEPTIEFLTSLGAFASATGNHEYDEGLDELLRLQNGGCHPVDGCQDGDGFAGAGFTYLSANVTRDGKLVMPAYAIKKVEPGVKLGFIGLPLKATPTIVTQSGIQGLVFGDEVEAVDRAAAKLRKDHGVESIVLLIHQGDSVTSPALPNSCNNATGPGIEISRRVSSAVDAVFTGHSHQPYACTVTDPAGSPRPVVQGGSFGRLISEIDLTIDRASGDVVRPLTQSRHHVVTRDVPKDAATTALLDKYRRAAEPIANREVGILEAPLSNSGNAAGESAMGDVIADAQLADTAAADRGGAQIALMNPGGIRNSLDAGTVTYGEAFSVQPFNNFLVTMSLTGAQIKTLLAQQFNNPAAGSSRILQPSRGFTYTYVWPGSGAPTITDVRLGGTPVDDASVYRVTVNSFLADGGDGFTVLREGTNRLTGGLDIDAFTAYLTANKPLAPPVPGRITRG